MAFDYTPMFTPDEKHMREVYREGWTAPSSDRGESADADWGRGIARVKLFARIEANQESRALLEDIDNRLAVLRSEFDFLFAGVADAESAAKFVRSINAIRYLMREDDA